MPLKVQLMIGSPTDAEDGSTFHHLSYAFIILTAKEGKD